MTTPCSDPPPDESNIVAPVDIRLTVSPRNVNEDAGETDFAVTATHNGAPQTTDVTIQLALGGTATAGSTGDYTAPAQASVTIPANSTSGNGTLTLTLIDDTEVEGDETIIVGGNSGTLTIASAVITIYDDEATYLSITGPANVAEGANATFTVTLSKAVSKAVTVAWNDVPGTAKTSDYTPRSATMTFAAGSTAGTAQSITIPVIDDNLSETTETFYVALGAVTADQADNVHVKTTASTAIATIAESDPITVSISGPSAVDEGETTSVYTVSLSPSGVTPTEDLTVDYAAAGGTATSGTDYAAKSGTLTFTDTAAGSQTFTIQTTEDTLDEGTGEIFNVTLSSLSGGGGTSSLGTATVSTTITDDDAASTSRITVNLSGPTSVNEGDETLDYTVSLSGGTPTSALTVSYATADGTATAGSDYTAKSGTLTFTQANHAAKTFTVQTSQDTIEEATGETFIVSISSPAGGGGPAPRLGTSSITTTIADDDAETDIALSVSPNTIGEDDEATEFTVTAALNGGRILTTNTVVTISLAGTATEDTDYTATTQASVAIPANSNSGTGTLTITPTDDDLVEGDETIVVSGTTTVGLDVSDATITLTDDNGSTTTPGDKDGSELSITGPESSVSEGSNAVFTVTLSKGVSKAVTVAWLAAGNIGDYSPSSGTVTFEANSAARATQDITVRATDDLLSEGEESFTVTLGSVGGDLSSQVSVNSGSESAAATISESDPITVNINGPSSVDEGDETSDYTVSLSGGTPTSALAVSYGTANGTATAGTDYTAKSGTLTFTPVNHASKTFTVQTADDTINEDAGETFTVSISNPTGGGATPRLGARSVTTTISENNDAPTDITLSIAGPAVSVAEGEDATFSVTLSKGVSKAVTVQWSAPLATDSAVAADLGSTSGTVTFPAGSTANSTRNITIRVTDDLLSEREESFTVTLGTVSGEVSVKSGSESAAATISESDPITVQLSGPSTVNEGEAGTYTVSLSPSGVTPTEDLTVPYVTADGTAIAGSDYTATSGMLIFTQTSAGAQTLTVSTIEDILDEQDETFRVSISRPINGKGPAPGLGTDSVITTITDNDDPADIALSVNPSSVGEDDGATTFTVTATLNRDNPLTVDTTVTIGSLDGTATENTDYSVTKALVSVTIPANASSGAGTITITPADDDLVEGDETIVVPGSTTSGLTVSPATITLTDDNQNTPTPKDKDISELAVASLSIAGPARSVSEGSDASFTVTLSQPVDAEVIVSWSALLGTDDAESSDLVSVSGTVTFAANSAAGATRTIGVTAADDLLSETAETFTVTLVDVISTLSSQVSLKSGSERAAAKIEESDPITVELRGPETVNEGEAVTYTVFLSPPGVTPTANLTVEYATSNGTAEAGDDYTAKSGTLIFTRTAATAQTFTVQTMEDSLDEGAGETFNVAISNPVGGGGPAPSLGAALVSTTIVDDADPNSPENVAVQSAYYGLGVARIGWSTPSEIIPEGYVVEWQEDLTSEVKQSTNLDNGARSYDIAGKLLAGWVRVGAVTLEGVNWSAPVFLSDDPLQAWFIDDTPSIDRNSSPNRLSFVLDANHPASGECTVRGSDIEVSDINCTPEILATLDYDPNAFGDTVSITGSTSAGSETAWHPVEWVNYGPSAPWVWVSGGNGELLMGWDAPAESGSGSVNGYVVQLRSRNADGSWSGWSDTEKADDARSHTFTGLDDGTYQVRVRARNDNNDSDPDTHTLGVTSEVRTVAVAAAITNLPGAPTRVVVTPGAGKLALKWQPPARERGSLVHLYTVRYKASDAGGYNEITVHPRTGINTCSKLDADGGSLWDEDPGCREMEISGLDSGTAYVVEIRTHNAVGVSQWTTIGNTHRPN